MAWVEVLFHGCFRILFIPITLLQTILGGSLYWRGFPRQEQGKRSAPWLVSLPAVEDRAGAA